MNNPTAEQTIERLTKEIEQCHYVIEKLQDERRNIQHLLTSMTQSLSWKITSPLRILKRFASKLRKN